MKARQEEFRLKVILQFQTEHSELLPSSWIQIKEILTQNKNNWINDLEFFSLCNQYGILEEKERFLLLRWLHEIGAAFFFDLSLSLKNTIFLKPQWLFTGIYSILGNSLLIENQGIFPREKLDKVLYQSSYPNPVPQQIIELLEAYEVCFSLKRKEIIFPSFLKVDEPNITIPDKKLELSFIYEFLPKFLFSKIIIRLSRLGAMGIENLWKTGVLMESPKGHVAILVKEHQKEKKITLSVWGKDYFEFLQSIRGVFHQLHCTFERFEVTECLPLPGYKERLVSLDILWNHLEDKIPVYYDGELRKRFPILNLLKEVYSPKEFRKLCLQRGIWSGQASEDKFINRKKKTAFPFALKQIFINGYRGVHTYQESIPVDASWIFLTGENGFGKTSLLQAIALGFFGPWENKIEETCRKYTQESIRNRKDEIKNKLYKDKSVLEVLRSLYHGKCAYCESLVEDVSYPHVEHYCPVKLVKNSKRHRGYYWLTFEISRSPKGFARGFTHTG